MADNTTVTAGSGTTLATNETTINGTAAHVQRVSLGAAPSVAYAAVACTSSATSIKAANYSRKSITVKAIDGTVYIGDASVTSATGFRLDIGESLFLGSYLGAVYGITSSGTTNIRYIEES